MKTLLIVDDERPIREGIKLALSDEKFEFLDVGNKDEAFELLISRNIDVMLLDVHFRGHGTCLDLLERVKNAGIDIPIIILSGAATAREAAEAIRLGAYDFIEKPASTDRLRVSLHNAISAAQVKAIANGAVLDRNVRSDFVGDSQAMRDIKAQILQFGRRDAKILITGETGTGKELVAHAIWKASTRAQKPFVIVNSAAIPENLIESELFGHKKGSFTGAVSNQMGKIEMADGGTLFLDEIGELSVAAQSKLLRFLENDVLQPVGSNKFKKCDVRLIAATSRDLNAEIKAGRFREDLYFRLNVGRIEMPPLRHRKEDILTLFRHFVSTVCIRYKEPIRTFEDGIDLLLQGHYWPGNIREVRNVAERCVLTCNDKITKEVVSSFIGMSRPSAPQVDHPDEPQELVSLKEYRKMMDYKYLKRVLDAVDGSVKKAAQILEVDRSHLHQKLKELGITSSNIS